MADVVRRVLTTMGLDASQYSRGAAAVAQANAGMVGSGAKVVETQTSVSRSTSTTINSLARLEAQVDRGVRAQQAMDRQLDLVNRAFQEGTISQQRHAELTRKVEDSYRRATAATKQAETAHRSFGDSVRLVTGLLAGLGIYLGARQLVQWARASLDAAGGLGELAQQLGVTVQSLQVYQYAATQAGLKQQELETGLARLSRTIGEAAQGEKTAADALARVGVAAVDAAGNVRSTDAVLRDIADRFAAMPNDAREAALAVDLFGKSGQKLLPILDQGSAGLDQFADRARRLGIVLSDEQVAAADKAADQWAEFEMVMTRLAQTIAVEMAPALADIFDTLSKPEVVDAIRVAFQALGTVIEYAVKALAGFLEVLAGAMPVMDEIVKLGQGVVNERLGGLPEMMKRLAEEAGAAIPTVEDLVKTLGGGGGSGDTDKAVENFEKISEAIRMATLDLEFEATLIGKSARETDYLRKRRELLNAAIATGNAYNADALTWIEKTAAQYADAAQRVRDLTKAHEGSTAAAKASADAAAKAAEDFERQVEQVANSIADDLTEALFEGGKNGFEDILSNIGEWVRRIGLEILKQQIILPITTQLVGAVPGLFGISGGGSGTIGGTNIFGAVTGLATDAFDWLGRQFSFGPSATAAASSSGILDAQAAAVRAEIGSGGSGGSFWDDIGGLGGILGGAASGYGIGGLVGSLLGARGPGSGIGGALGGALGTLTTSFLGPLGPILGGALGGLVGSLFGPKPSSGPFSYGTAHSQGGRLAYVNSVSLKGGVGDMAPLVNETTAVANQLADLFGAEFADNALLRIGYIANEKGVKGYAVSGSGRKGTNDAFNNYKFFGENKQAAQLFAIEQAIMGGGFNGLSVGGGLQGLTEQERGYLGKSFDIRKTTEEVLKDAALVVDLFGETEAASSEAAKALRELNAAYDEQVQRAKELGIAETEIERRRAEAIQQLKTGFVEGIEDQILAITDPTAFALKQLDKEFEAIRANAEDFGVGMVEVERLYGLKRQQVLEQIARTTVADLQRFLEELQFGDLSGGSPGNRLSGARAAFEATAAQALAGDAAARGRVQDLGTTLLGLSRDYNASGSGYFADLARVEEVVRALLEGAPGYASGTLSAPGGWSWTGERGRELMYVPQGAAILPNAISEMIARGGANDSQGAALRELVGLQTQIAAALRQKATTDDGLRSEIRQLNSGIRRLLALAPAEKAA